ncbi:cytochrome c oxidase accessory protein CcoG [Marinomonas gallaica]|uniref:cytochrome c oxidase accessory protein CcoG n=1 Tax=Marinomonas gallaica TaxID=1806667 RepID=UPI00083286A4|nr:cytochrome c oxidase accessory protein CcoG [Marinomonas gallaica]
MQKIPLKDTTVSDGKIYVRLIKGRFQTLRRLISWPMLTAFFLLCWLRIDDVPVLMFSFSTHRILLFGLELSWYDLQLLGGLLIAGATLMFFLSMLAGRVWCGFACPQSVWTWIFIRIEDVVEGKANRRAKQDKQPIKQAHVYRRLLKHALWLIVSVWTALTFTGYFVDLYSLLSQIIHFELPIYLVGWLMTVSAFTYLNAGIVREKICLHACPYSRFQSVMLDQHSKVVSYDVARGEPRVSKRQLAQASRQGDCVDCTLCVQVCPVGIDIRQGLQAPCINCGACIDACDSVMKKLSKPLGLVRFASESELEGQRYQLLRPRLIGYFSVMSIAFATVAYGFTQTTDLLVEFNRERGAMYSIMGNGDVCNFYKVKAEAFNIEAKTMQMRVGNSTYRIYGDSDIALKPGDAYWRSVRLCTNAPAAGKTAVEMVFTAGDATLKKTTTFFAPRH